MIGAQTEALAKQGNLTSPILQKKEEKNSAGNVVMRLVIYPFVRIVPVAA